MVDFYDCEPLLSMKDKHGEVPAIFIVCSRVRGPGKTFSFTWKLMRDYFDFGHRFVLLSRTQKETGTVADGMFKAMLDVKYPGYSLVEKKRQSGVYSDVYLTWKVYSDEDDDEGTNRSEHCGYVVALNASDSVKKISSHFSDAQAIYFDEFMPEHHDTYLKNEVSKFHSVYKSIARGGGESSRYVPVYMSSNTISVANPYFIQMGLSGKIQPETKRVRGDGWVFQRATNDALVDVHASSPFERAMGGLRAGKYDDNSWVNDSTSGVCKPDRWGSNFYVGTLEIDDQSYGFRVYPEVGLLYVSRSVDESFPGIYRADSDGDLTAQLLRASDLGWIFKRNINRGTVRFQDQTCKMQAITHLI